ncbi:hypothetical protein BCV70DRAFT_87455 [Testicularia cyperi]|uniref:VTT domain-containing protein n=1 Tax=Testicularia cyperi TaxID=1882483 RepID=A0A317XUL6_9BASI|nr:hypothetical protein BCV70DRAFT_87455 [Testicularia cyperi]
MTLSTKTSTSPPRLHRSVTERPTIARTNSSGQVASTSRLAAPRSIEELAAAGGLIEHLDSDAADVTVSSASARRGNATRARTRSVSSNAVPVSQLAKSALAPIDADLSQHLDRGPGTPDFTLAASTPRWRRDELEKRNTVASSLGQGLRLISEAETSTASKSFGRDAGSRPRSNSDASTSSSSGSSQKKKTAPIAQLPRPRLSSLRSFFSSFSASAPNTVHSTPAREDPTGGLGLNDSGRRSPARPQPLVMPSARPAGPSGLRGLNEDSPPLTPNSDLDEHSAYHQYLKAFQGPFVPQTQSKHQGAPKHQWSAAQAAADAAHGVPDERHTITPPHLSQWTFTPPLTVSTTTSPVASSRAFSPPTRPDSNSASSGAFPHGLLPSHMVSAYGGSRPPTPTSTLTTSSERSARSYSVFDVNTYRVGGIGKGLVALLPRVQINLSSWRISMPNVRPFVPRMLFLLTIFVAATCCIVFMLSTLPLTLPNHISGLTLAEIKEMATSLKTYSQSSSKAFTHTLLVIGAFFTWKQSFTVPGSLLMNVVFGAMYGTYWGTLYTSVLTAVGGVFCYLLSAPLAPLITSLPGLAKPLDAMRRALSPGRAHASGRSVMISNSHRGSDGNVWTYLLVLRVLPIVPYGLMNIACGVLGVPLLPYGVTLAIGSIPWNFVTCQVGDLLQEIVEAIPLDEDMTVSGIKNKTTTHAGGGMREIIDHIWTRDMMIKLVLLSIASLLPMVLSRYLKYRQRQQNALNVYEPVETSDDLATHRYDEENDHSGSRRTSQLLNEPVSSAMSGSVGLKSDARSANTFEMDQRFGHVRESTDQTSESSGSASGSSTSGAGYSNDGKVRRLRATGVWL